jgi:hypothetical protein
LISEMSPKDAKSAKAEREKILLQTKTQEAKLKALGEAAQYSFPTADIAQMLQEIERSYSAKTHLPHFKTETLEAERWAKNQDFIVDRMEQVKAEASLERERSRVWRGSARTGGRANANTCHARSASNFRRRAIRRIAGVADRRTAAPNATTYGC